MVVTWVSKKGGRSFNEDAVGKARAKGILCVVVADGLGGHDGGSLASQIVVDTIIESFKKSPGFSEGYLADYIENARDAVVNRAMDSPELTYMSSTVVVLLIKGHRAMWANVGDSRLYRFNSGYISEVTEDDSVAFMDFVRGEIEYDMIRTSPNQNKLTNAVGITMDGINFSKPKKITGSECFLLCTDGWWEYVNEDDMEKNYAKSRNAREWLNAMLEIREKKAPDNSDNYTATVIAF